MVSRSYLTPLARQWCFAHDQHQDDPEHPYSYEICEEWMRPSTATEDLRVRFKQLMFAFKGKSK